MTLARAIEVLYIEPEKLLTDPRNAREHSDEQIAQIVASIREFGFNDPIQIDETGMVLAGHGTLRAAQYIGLSRVPCTPLLHLTEAQKVGYSLAHNKIALNAEWNQSTLAEALRSVRAADFGKALGFDASELRALTVGDLQPAPAESLTPLEGATHNSPRSAAKRHLAQMVTVIEAWEQSSQSADASAKALANLADLAREARVYL